jgi:hypothetical protein
MSGYSIGLACFVLFDAHGAITPMTPGPGGTAYATLAFGAALLLLALKHAPRAIQRPQQSVDALCDDALCITAHAACIAMLSADPVLMHGCALHSACYIAEHRFRGRMPSLATGTVVYTAVALALLAAYLYGARITDTRRYMLSAVCPYGLELLARLLSHAHRVAVMTLAELM